MTTTTKKLAVSTAHIPSGYDRGYGLAEYVDASRDSITIGKDINSHTVGSKPTTIIQGENPCIYPLYHFYYCRLLL